MTKQGENNQPKPKKKNAPNFVPSHISRWAKEQSQIGRVNTYTKGGGRKPND